MSVARHHADWLSLLEISGPFVSMPVLMRVFPQGLDPRDPEQARQLRLAYEEWQCNPAGPGKHRAWINQVLTGLLSFPTDLIAEGQSLPPGLSASMAEYGETLRADMALVGPKGTDAAGKPQLLVSLYPLDQLLERPVSGKHWKASPGTRMMELLHASDVPVGLVTNGEQWMLVFAPRGETTGFTSWYANLWIDESVTLRAFHSLLSINRFFGVAATDTLSALLMDSSQDQQEVTSQLGEQVRGAVEVLIQAFDRLDQESGRILLRGVEEKTLYDAALTVMMRLVFLFSAEERGLLHLGRPIYDNNYAVSTLREQLQEVADRHGEEVLERRFDAWSRLLSSFRAVHSGVQHQDLLMPAYGGSLFDPDRYSFLEGRPRETDWHVTFAEPLAINNRVVLHLLKSLQMLQVKVAGGGPAEARRISFRALDIEQIGHIYEGLLDHTAYRARDTVLGLVGTRKNPTPNITLDELEKLSEQGEATLLEELKELTERSIPALKKDLAIDVSKENHDIHIACGQNEKLAARIMPFAGLLRADSFDHAVIVLGGGICVGQGTSRRGTGTHYTPRSLTEQIVQRTLEPVVYLGPSEGLTKEHWELKLPREILDLKICDMAMGSGAFLVQTCRYLSERLVEAWENLEKAHPGELLSTPEGLFSKGLPTERLVPKDAVERLAIARRVVADRCLFGVDINPMAVEMAKLSIWLITVDKMRPFTFLDHALKCGDSLVGLHRLKQLETFSLDDSKATQAIILSNYDLLIQGASAKRRQLETLPSNDAVQIATKECLNAEAEDLLSKLKLASDLLMVAALTNGSQQEREVARVGAHLNATEFISKPLEEFRQFVREQLSGRRTFHWPLEFPEVFEMGGFDAFVGNPPFLGGRRISFRLSSELLAYLKSWLHGPAGTTDMCVYFLLRTATLSKGAGYIGLVLSDIISQGESRTNGLEYLLSHGLIVYDCISSTDWPGQAGVKISHLHLTKNPWRGTKTLNGQTVETINAYLQADESKRSPQKLPSNEGLCYSGHYLMGQGFVLDEQEAKELLRVNAKSNEVIFPYIRGDDVNNTVNQASGLFAINFSMRTLEVCRREYPECLELVRRTVKPERDLVKRKANRERWWRYAEARPGLEKARQELERVLVQPFTAKYVLPTFVDANCVFAHPLVVIVRASYAIYACLQSTLHEKWVWQHCSTSLDLFRYTASTVLETFPFPTLGKELEALGSAYYGWRQHLIASSNEDLNRIYNRFHDGGEKSKEIERLRELHVELDLNVTKAYGWTDLNLEHGFYETKQGMRYTITNAARSAVLDRLLALNHQRFEEQTRASVSTTKAQAVSANAHATKAKPEDDTLQDRLFAAEDSE